MKTVKYIITDKTILHNFDNVIDGDVYMQVHRNVIPPHTLIDQIIHHPWSELHDKQD